MLAALIALLISLGIITSEADYQNLSSEEQIQLQQEHDHIIVDEIHM